MGENPSNERPVLVERSRGGKETSLVSGAWLTKYVFVWNMLMTHQQRVFSKYLAFGGRVLLCYAV